MLRLSVLLIALLSVFPAIAQTPSKHRVSCVQLGSFLAGNATCICVDNDKVFGDRNCNDVKDVGEEYLDNLGTSPGSNSIGTDELNNSGGSSPLAGECVVVQSGDTSKLDFITCPGGGSNCGVGTNCVFDSGDSVDGAGLTFSGSTSGTSTLKAAATANGVSTLPTTTGVLISSGDNGTITSTMVFNNTLTFADIANTSAIDVPTVFTAADGVDLTFTTISQSGNMDFLTLDAYQQSGGSDETFNVLKLELLSEGDVADSMYGVSIVQEDSSTNTVIDAGIWINNLETTAATMADGIRVTSTGVNNGVTDGIDVSGSNILYSVNTGANPILTSLGVVEVADLDVIDGSGAYGTGLVGVLASVPTNIDSLSELNDALGGLAIPGDAHPTNFITDDLDDQKNAVLTISPITSGNSLIVRQNSTSAGSSALLITTTQSTDTNDYFPFAVREDSGGANNLLASIDSTGNVYAQSFTSQPTPVPKLKLNDSQNAGLDDADKLAASWSADCTQTTEDDEICDFDLNVVMQPTGTETSVINMDGSAKTLNIATSLPATAAVVIGSANMGSLTVTTASSGNSAVVLPSDSIGSAEIDTEVRSMYWGAGALIADGTKATAPASTTFNSTGPIVYTIGNTATAGVIYGQTVMPDSWDGGNTLVFEINAVNENATPSGTYIVTFAAICTTPETDAIGNSWGTGVAATITFDTQDRAESAVTTSVTPGGSACAGGDVLFWKGTTSGSTSQWADIDILGVKMEYVSNVGD